MSVESGVVTVGEFDSLMKRMKSMPVEHTHQTVNPHSVELSLTSAGKVSGSVKVYAETEGEAFERAAAIMDKLRARYPTP